MLHTKKEGSETINIFIAVTCFPLSSIFHNATSNVSLVLRGEKNVLTIPDCAGAPQNIGAECSLFCPAGYVLIGGQSQVVCGEDGVWKATLPR